MSENDKSILEKLLNGRGVSDFWDNVNSKIKSITGAVDVKTDGTLQAQISALNSKVTALQGEIEDIGTFYLSTEDGINILTEDGYSLITEQSL